MKKIIFPLLLLFFISSIQAKKGEESYRFRLYLHDKGNSKYTLVEPEEFLSKQSIERKKRQGVVIDETDFPISDDYFNQISLAGGKVVSYSKWFKTLVVHLNDSSQINNLTDLSFVDSAKYVWRGEERQKGLIIRPRLQPTPPIEVVNIDTINGLTEAQFVLHNAKDLYRSGYVGRGMNIGVIDAGFTNVDVIPYFEPNNIIEYESFVPHGEVLVDSDHGTKVLSTISAVVPGQMMGSSPAANFYLLHSEDVSTEFPVEEDYWVRAVEYADSVGVDVINSSLGYSKFDDKELSYSHNILNGRTSIMSLAADMAFDKGMIVVTSAGNEGSKEWQKISVPGDAAKALTVGAVNSEGKIASFSSKGFTADNRLKPDVVSVGNGTIIIGQDGAIGRANGTSFSSPFMAGLVATLWSINPEMDRGELLHIIRESSDRYHNPDSVYGNGIPDISMAMRRVMDTVPICDDKYEDELFCITKVDDNIEIEQKDNAINSSTYIANLIDESGELISKKVVLENNLNILIGDGIKKNNTSVFVLITSPQWQKTVRIKL